MLHELARSRVTAQDQISVPAEVRKRFGIRSGSELGWYEEDGRLIVDLARTHTLADARTALGRKPSPGTAKDVKAAIKAHVAEKFKRAGR
jgi:AbrB family looped-hinge helix DNA binding protein